MTILIHPSLAAIRRQLKADYLTSPARPVPHELKALIEQLVAIENVNRESAELSLQLLQPAETAPQSIEVLNARQTDWTE
jgi:hypothetical protein